MFCWSVEDGCTHQNNLYVGISGLDLHSSMACDEMIFNN